MVYVLEFFALEPNGQRDRIDGVKCRATTIEMAAERAQTMASKVKVRGRRPQVCVIKDQLGVIFKEVELEAA
jgi:hypothetical protein